MELIELLKNFLTGILSNAAYDTIKSGKQFEPSSPIEKRDIEIKQGKPPISFPVESLYAYYDEHPNDWFLPLIKIIHEPNVYIFLEVESSTFYNLGAVVLEDNRTNDWFPFYKPVALQGTAGGWGSNSRSSS